MKRKEPVITTDDLTAAVEEARLDFAKNPETRPPGALTIQEWGARLSICETTMRDKMRRAVAEGRYERLTARVRNVSGQVYTSSVYRKKKETPDAKPVDRLRRPIL